MALLVSNCLPDVLPWQRSSLSLLQPFRHTQAETSYHIDFPMHPVERLRLQPFVPKPATEISKDASHFRHVSTETGQEYVGKLPDMVHHSCENHLKASSVRMHSDQSKIDVYHTSNQMEFGPKPYVSIVQTLAPPRESKQRVLPGDVAMKPEISEHQDNYRPLSTIGGALTSQRASDPDRDLLQGDRLNRYTTIHGEAFQRYEISPAKMVPNQYPSTVFNQGNQEVAVPSCYQSSYTPKTPSEDDAKKLLIRRKLKNCNLFPWNQQQDHSTSFQTDYPPRAVSVTRVKSKISRTRSDIPEGDHDRQREVERRQYNTHRHFFGSFPISDLVQSHVSGAKLRTKSDVAFKETDECHYGTTCRDMFKPASLYLVPSRHKDSPPGAVALNYGYDIPCSTNQSDFTVPATRPTSELSGNKLKEYKPIAGSFFDLTTQKDNYRPYAVIEKPKTDVHRCLFSSVPLPPLVALNQF